MQFINRNKCQAGKDKEHAEYIIDEVKENKYAIHKTLQQNEQKRYIIIFNKAQ